MRSVDVGCLLVVFVVVVCFDRGSKAKASENCSESLEKTRSRDIRHVIGDRTLNIGTLEADPYLRVNRGKKGRIFEGLIPDLMAILSRLLRFRYRFHLLDPPVYGSLENGTWTGLIGEVVNKKVDLAAAPISITSAREQVVDFVKPFQTLGMSILVQRPRTDQGIPSTAGRQILSAVQPIDASVWAATLALTVLVWVTLWLLNIYNPHEYGCRFKLGLAEKSEAETFNLSGTFWYVFATLQRQGFDKSPRSAASKFLSIVWFGYATLFLTSYIAGVVNHLIWVSVVRPTPDTERPQIVDLTHLLTTRTDYKVGAINNSQTFHYVTEVAAGHEFKALGNQWLTTEGRSHLVSNLTEGLQRVRSEKYALIVESMVAKLYTNRRPCDLVTVGEEFGRRSYGLALPIGSPLRSYFDSAILELIEDGTLEELERRWYTGRGECWNVTQQERLERDRSRFYAGKARSLDANSFSGPFVVVIACVMVTCVIATAEILYYRHKSKYSNTANTTPLQGEHPRIDPDEGNM